MKVPVYNTQVNLDTPNVPVPPNPGANRAAFGGQVYEANANLGKVGTDIAGALQKHAENQRKIQNDSLIAQADTNYRMAMQDRTLSNDQEDYEVNGQKYQRPIGLLNRQLDSAAGSTEEFDKWHNEQLNSVLKQFPDQQSRDRLVNSLNNHYFTMRDNVIGHEAKQQRAGNVARLEGNIGQKMRDSVVAQDPISLSQALDEVGLTQEELNNANGFDRATSDLNIAKTTGKLAETSILSSLDTDPTGAKATLLLDSVKNKLDPAAYKEISDNVKKSSKKLLEDAKYNAKQAKYINEAKLLFDFADGKLGNMNVSQLNDLANSGKVRNEFATAAIRAIQRPINAFEDDDMTFVERANGIFDSKNPEQTNAALLDVLDGFSSGNLGQDKMTLLIQSAKKIGDKRASDYKDNFDRVFNWGNEAGLRIDRNREVIQDYLQGINAGDDAATSADKAIQRAIQKQSVGSKKEKDLNNDVISSFDYISSEDRRKKIVGMKDLDAGLYQYLLKSGLSPDDASKKSYDIISSAGTPDNSFEYIKKITDSMDREIPGWRATSSPVKDYLLKKEEQLNPTRTFNIVKEGMKMSWEQLRQHPFKTSFEAGARYPKAVMKFLEQVQLGDKIDMGKTGQGVFAPNDPDHRSTVEIAQDIGSRIIPEPVIKDPNDRFEYYGKVVEQFMYYLPFSTAGVLTEFGLDPAIKLSFDGLGNILKIPAVAKIMGKEFKGPEWFDSMVKNAVNRFHSPFAKTAEEVRIIREKQINELTDIINEKMGPRMPEIKKAYEKSYGSEPTPEDIKGLIKKKLIDEGVYDRSIEEVAKAINKVKKSGVKFTDVAEVKQGQPGNIVMDKATGKPLEVNAAEVAKAKEIKMNQLKVSRAAAVESGDAKVVKKIDSLIAKNIEVPTPEEMLANRKVGLTQQAIAFAEQHSATKDAAIQALERAGQETQARIDEIKRIPDAERTDEQDVQAYTLGQVKQFYREATESLQGKLDLARSTSAIDNAMTGKVSDKFLQKMTPEGLTKYIEERKAGGALSEELNKLTAILKEKTGGKNAEGNGASTQAGSGQEGAQGQEAERLRLRNNDKTGMASEAIKPGEKVLAKTGQPRPEKAKQFIPIDKLSPDVKQAKPWEVLEGDYWARVKAHKLAAYANSIKGYKEMLTKVSPKAPAQKAKIQQNIQNTEYWVKRIEGADTAAMKNMFGEDYLKQVKEAISKGEPVPQEVINQHPEFRKALDARERYEKGLHTSFANRSIAVDDTMQAEGGYKVKRQDGKTITINQKREIEQGVADTEKAIGPIRDLMRNTDVTIAHTTGTHPFLRHAGGLYSTGEKTVTIGTNIGPIKVKALGHELAGHWLDYEAGRALGKEVSIYGGGKGYFKKKIGNASSLAETDMSNTRFAGSKNIQTGEIKQADPVEAKGAALIKEAAKNIHAEKEAQNLVSKKLTETTTEEEKNKVRVAKLKLGDYWHEPREIWARLTEQYIATKLGVENDSVMPLNYYENAPGYWTREDFAKMIPQIEEQIQRRVNAVRGETPKTEGMLNEKTQGQEGLQEVKLKPGPDTANAGKATSGKIIKHFTKSENIQSILKEGFNTSKPPIHGTGGLQGGPRTGKSGKDVLYFTADDARWKDAVVYVGEGKGNISRDAYDYENQKWVKENNAYKKVSLEPIEASIKENAKILTIDSLKGAKDFLGSKFDKYEMINNLVDKARADGYDVLNLKNPGGKKWDDTTPNKMGNLNRYDELTGGSGKDDFFIINREIIDIKNPSKPAKKGLSSESGQTILPGVGAAGEALGKALEPSNLEGLYQKAINRFQSIENAVDKAKALGADIKPGEDAGLSATRYLSISNQADAVLRDGPFKITKEGKVEVVGEGLQKILTDYEKLTPEKNIESRRQDLKDYLIAKRTIEDLQRPRNESSDENIVSPEQVAAAKKSLDNLTNKYGTGLNLFEDTANRLYDYQKNVLHTLVDNGLMSQEMFDRVLEKNPHYIPFDRVLPTEAQAGAMPTAKQPFSGVKSPVKSIKGSELEIHDVIDSVVKNTYRIMDRAARNKVFVDVHSMMKYPELGIKAVHADMRPIKLSEAETGGDEQTIFRPSPFKPKGNVVEGYIDGKRKYLEVSENMYKAMTGMDEVSSGIIVKLLSQPASWLRTGATITPEFIMRNPIRDQWTALIQTHVGFRPFIDPAGAVADILGKSAIYNEWIRSGGSYASFVELSRPQLKKMSDEIMGNPSILSKLNILNTLQGISQLMEQATRLGVYKAGIRSGLSPVEAGKQSRESTLDFGRRGTSTKEINSVIAFFNAGIQSLDKTARLAKEDPGGMTMKALAAITIPSLLLYLKNRQDPDYKEIPRWQRDLFWMTKIGNTWVRVPKPFLYGQVFGSIPERFFEYVESKDPQAFNKLGDSLYNALSPVAGDPISGLLPTGVKPLVENETNWSFFRGRPIVPVSKQRLIPSEQTSDYDTETSKVLGKILNVSPSKIENLVSGYFGGSGRYVMQGGELLLNEVKKLRGEEIKKKLTTPSDIPLVKGFVAREPISGQAESVQKFYDTKNNINKLQATYHSYLKNGQNEKANDFLAKYPELKYSKEFDSVSKQIGKLSEQIDLVTQSKTMQESEKRKEIERLNRIKLDLAINANKRFSSGK